MLSCCLIAALWLPGWLALLVFSTSSSLHQLVAFHAHAMSAHNPLTPCHRLVSTRVGGEKRFAAAVARRLQSLGALTRGDRRAASGIDLSEQNFDSPLGRRALRRMYDAIVTEAPTLPQVRYHVFACVSTGPLCAMRCIAICLLRTTVCSACQARGGPSTGVCTV